MSLWAQAILALLFVLLLISLCRPRPGRVVKQTPPEPARCDHNDVLCARYGCPYEPDWKGDGCA